MTDSKVTKISSNQFRVRREDDVLIIENIASDLSDAEHFVRAFREALAKEGKGIVVHLPNPKWVTSLVIDALGTAAKIASDEGRPFTVVVHPKIRLLIRMFGLEEVIPSIDRLQAAIDDINA